jgi:hypothetical protein
MEIGKKKINHRMELFFVGHAPVPKQKVYTDQINVVVKNCANVYSIN